MEGEREALLVKQRDIEEKAHAARLEEMRVAEEARLTALRLQLEIDRAEAEQTMEQQQRALEEQRQHQQAQEVAAKEKAEASDRRHHDAEMMAVLERTRAEAMMSMERARQDTAGATMPFSSTPHRLTPSPDRLTPLSLIPNRSTPFLLSQIE